MDEIRINKSGADGTWHAWLPDRGITAVTGWEDVAELRRHLRAKDRWETDDFLAFCSEHGEPDLEALDTIMEGVG